MCVFFFFCNFSDTCWSADSADILSQLTKGIVLQAQVAGYNSQNIPEIYLFACLGPNVSILLFMFVKS